MRDYVHRIVTLGCLLSCTAFVMVLGGCGSSGQEKMQDSATGSSVAASGSAVNNSGINNSGEGDEVVSGGNVTVRIVESNASSEETDSKLDYYDDQLLLIWENRDMWMAREDITAQTDQVGVYFNFEPYTKYMITDLDRNGRLEVISSETNGNGYIFSNQYLEVDEDRQQLNLCKIVSKDSDGEVRMPDLWYVWGDALTASVDAPVYYDKNTETWHYTVTDRTHTSAKDTTERMQDFSLKDGKIRVKNIREEKKYYKGMTKCKMNAHWFMSCEQTIDENTGKYKQFSDEDILMSMKKSWNNFVILAE